MAALLAATVAAGALATGTAVASSPIYKCFDRSLSVVYTDLPCSGEQLDVRAGDADPAALAALQREREALSRSMEQRIADQRRAALGAGRGPEWPYAPATASQPYAGDDAYAYGGVAPFWYGGTYDRAANRRPSPPRDRTAARERTVPNPPPGLPRR